MEGEKRLRYFQERFLERKTEEVTAKHEKEDTEEKKRKRDRRGIIIKMREISKILDLGGKMVSPGIKGSPRMNRQSFDVSWNFYTFRLFPPPLRPWEVQQFLSFTETSRPRRRCSLYLLQ